MKSSRWIGTLNNPQNHYEEFMAADWLEKIHNSAKAVYTCGQLETGAEGTVHLQYFMSFKDPCRVSALKKLCPHSHWQEVKKDNGAADYCQKEETRLEGPWQYGQKPLKRNDKKDWEEIKENAKKGNLDAVPADVYVRHYHTLRAIAKDHARIEARTQPKQCFWIWGKPGTGKTRAATLTYPNAYRKLLNKWWDGYQGEKEVIMDDLGAEMAKFLTSHLKHWADPWNNHLGEIKQSALPLKYDVFVVTSNYHPSDLFEGVDLEAIMRRFEIKEVTPEYLEFHPGKVFNF